MRHHYVSFALKDHRVYKLLMVVLSISRCQPATLPVPFDYLFSARVFMEHTNNKKGPSTRGGESNFKLLSTSRMPQPRPGVCLTDNFLNILLPEKCRRIPGIMRMKWRRHVASVPFILTTRFTYLTICLWQTSAVACQLFLCGRRNCSSSSCQSFREVELSSLHKIYKHLQCRRLVSSSIRFLSIFFQF